MTIKPRFIVGIVVVALLGAGFYYIWNAEPEGPKGGSATNTSSGMLAEDNAVIALDQKPGSTVTVSAVYLAKPGFVVIHEEKDGAPGAIIGASALLSAGENTNVAVNLTRATFEGETLYAMLHTDADGSGTFDAASDTSVESILGGPIVGFFSISEDADAGVEISL